MRTIGDLAQLSGVTIRTLHHYDRIGLLGPLARSQAGYRLYGREELLRLREILIWRRLGFPLADIAALLDDPGHDQLEALRHQLKLAETQLDKFQGLTRGLKAAIAVHDAGGSVVEEQVFAGFARALAQEDGAEARPRPAQRRIHTFSLLSGRSPQGTADGFGVDPLPQRIVATDPIRLAESLIALGIMPVGTGTYEDRFSGRRNPGEWTWSPLIERPVRNCIANVGFYGSDAERIGALAPDLILELTSFSDSASCLSESSSGGRYGYDTLAEIAPTELVPYRPDPWSRPAFRHFLRGVAANVGRRELAEALLALWDARIRVMGAQLPGTHDVAVVGTWGLGSIWGDTFYAPTELHYSQVFTEVGIVPVLPSEGSRPGPDAVAFDADRLRELETDLLFVHTRHLDRDEVGRLLSDGPFAGLRAARCGRVFELGWEFVNSGWFGAHWQLALIAHAFGLTQFAAGDGDELVVAAVDPNAGTLALTSVYGELSAVLLGPQIAPIRIELSQDRATAIELGAAATRELADLPELYSLGLEGHTAPAQFSRDRESALMRLCGGTVTPTSATTSRASGTPGPPASTPAAAAAQP